MVQRLIQRADYINARLRRLQRQDPTTNDDALDTGYNKVSIVSPTGLVLFLVFVLQRIDVTCS